MAMLDMRGALANILSQSDVVKYVNEWEEEAWGRGESGIEA